MPIDARCNRRLETARARVRNRVVALGSAPFAAALTGLSSHSHRTGAPGPRSRSGIWRRTITPGSRRHGAAVSYDEFKEHEGQKYTGMKIGHGHKRYYDQGEWKEKKITPDLWQIS
jgi:hypothetical protein